MRGDQLSTAAVKTGPPLHRIALLSPRASAVPELIFSTRRCLTFFRTETQNIHEYVYATTTLTDQHKPSRRSLKTINTAKCRTECGGGRYRCRETSPALGLPAVCCSGLLLPPE